MDTIIFIVMLAVLVYYMWSNWPALKSKPYLAGILILGMILWLAGMGWHATFPKNASLARFIGIVLILAGMGISALQFKKSPPEDK